VSLRTRTGHAIAGARTRLTLRSLVWPLTAGAVCAAFLLAGCSTATSPPPPGISAKAVLRTAAAKMGQLRSYTETYSIASTPVSGSTIPSMPSLTGTVGWQNRPVELADEKSYSHDSAIPMPGGMETIIDNGVVYMKIGMLSKFVGKPWIKIDTAAMSGTAAALAPVAEAFAPGLQAYAQLFAPSTNVHRVGSQVINGVPATEYAGTVSIASGLSHLPASIRNLMAPGFSSIAGSTSHFTVWIDGQFVIRKEVTTQQVPNGSVVVTVVVTSINQPVTVRVPPASQVATMPGL
jgi:hypothetical protein